MIKKEDFFNKLLEYAYSKLESEELSATDLKNLVSVGELCFKHLLNEKEKSTLTINIDSLITKVNKKDTEKQLELFDKE